MCLFVALLAFFVVTNNGVNSAKILAIVPTPSFSHQIAFRELWKELSLRGHHLTLITTDPMNNATLPNITEINIGFSYKTWHKKVGVLVKLGKKDSSQFTQKIFGIAGTWYEEQLSYEPIRSLILNTTEHFDLVIAESMHIISYTFASRFNCPLIGISSTDAFATTYSSVGSPTHPVVYPDYNSPYQGIHKSFMQRLYNVKHYIYMMYIAPFYVSGLIDPIVVKHFGRDYTPYDGMEKLSLMLLNKSPIFYNVRATVPSVVYFGGASHLAAPKGLPMVRSV